MKAETQGVLMWFAIAVASSLAFGSILSVTTGQPAIMPKRIVAKKDHAEMILIPAGPFTYGMSQQEIKSVLKQNKLGWAEIYAFELPKTQKQVPSFYIDRYEVTNSQYAQF